MIEDFDASVVEAMLCFMYSFDYTNSDGTSSMVYNAQVYQIADKYDIQALKAHSKTKFGAVITRGWNTSDFPLAISVVYETTPLEDRGLRDLVVEKSRKNINELLKNDDFSKLLRETPDFAADLIPFLCEKPATPVPIPRYECPSCHHSFRAEFSQGAYHCPSCGKKRSNWDIYQTEGEVKDEPPVDWMWRPRG